MTTQAVVPEQTIWRPRSPPTAACPWQASWSHALTVPAMIAPPDEVPPMAGQAVVPEQTIWDGEVTPAPPGVPSDTKIWVAALTVPAMRTGVVAVLPVPMARQAVVPEQTIWDSEVTPAPPAYRRTRRFGWRRSPCRR